MSAKIITLQEDAPRIDRVILKNGDILLIRTDFTDDTDHPYRVITLGGREIRDPEIAFYLRVGERITVGILMEALGPDWVVW